MIDDIRDTLNHTPGLHILFFFDVSEEQLDTIHEADLGDIQHVHVERNFIETSVKLETDLKHKKVLLTFPYLKPENKEWVRFPLAGFYYANKELRLDQVGKFMNQFGLKPYQQKLVNQYKKELLTKKNKERLASILSPDRFDEQSLKRGLISSTLDFASVVSEELILAKIFKISREPKKYQQFINKINSLDLQDTVVNYFQQYLDDDFEELSAASVVSTGNKIKYNLITRYIPKVLEEDSYKSLKYQNSLLRNRFLGVIQSWEDHPQLNKSFRSTLDQIGKDIKEQKIISWYGLEHDYGFYSNELLSSMATVLVHQVEKKPAQAASLIQPLLQKNIDEGWQKIFECMYHAAQMLACLDNCAHFDYNRPEDYLYEYQNNWFQIDQHYRKFISIHQLVFTELDFSLEALYQVITLAYEGFLKRLNISWQQLITEKEVDFTEVQTPQQYNFYEEQVATNPSKMAVIISDALRFEIGKELTDTLQQDTKNKVQLDIGLASIPSITALGMTNLLPGEKIEIQPSGEVWLDDRKTQTTKSRTDILTTKNPNAKAISYKEISKLSRDEGRQLFNNHSPVYIYHNEIDKIGDSQQSEDKTFEAVERTINELKRLIMKVYSWNVYHLVVTADHGFIYTHEPLKDDTLEDAPKGNHVINVGSRYALIKSDFKGEIEGYRLPLNRVSHANNDYDLVLPRAVNRFRKAGAGNHYIHGGASLQELLIPIIKFYRKKEGVSEVVSIKLLTKNLSTTGSLKLNFLQMEPVSDELKPLKVSLGLFDDQNQVVSNLEELDFGSTSNNPTDRSQTVILTLNNKGSQLKQCQLKVFEENDSNKLNPILVKTVIVDALMEKDEF